jgi:phosphoribosylformylglycinamidine cyclo-ligase
MSTLDYKQAGVDYTPLDAFKRACQQAASTTRKALEATRYREVTGIRGESAFLLEADDHFLAHVEEGLGTKNLVADAVYEATRQCHYRAIGIDTVATMVNDLITCGASPISIAMHAAVGDGAWFNDAKRAGELAAGFAQGCIDSNAVWGGGETPALKGLVDPSTIVLAGSAVGEIRPKSRLVSGQIQAGDAIVFLASSGVHTNGLTLCRAIASKLPQGYQTPVKDGKTFGELLLAPSVIYAKFVQKVLDAKLRARYFVHMTGHGWRKIMRNEKPFVYRIDDPTKAGAKIPALFEFIIKHGPVETREAFATFNMGVGWAVMVDQNDAAMCVRIAQSLGHEAWIAGQVLEQAGRKAVEIAGKNLIGQDIVFESDSLAVR